MVAHSVFDADYAPPVSELSDRFRAFNRTHDVLQRIDKRTFRYTDPLLEPVLFDSRTIRLYADYNVALCSGEGIPEAVPAFYVYFAKEMNAKDDCGYGWAYIEEGVIVWDEKLTVADPDSYCVLDTETTDRIMPVGHVAVSEAYRANAERLILRASLQDNKHTRIREQKKALKERDSGPDIHTADAKDAFARKRKAIKDAAIATAAKKAKIAADEAAGPSGAPADGSTDTSMVN
ncbi:hypothetical protein C8R44DRAFT_736342 [Mycena epipterygia]|nr:hypothetical protein C8R44DRAFT_736342 [Mycena epipterygia]